MALFFAINFLLLFCRCSAAPTLDCKVLEGWGANRSVGFGPMRADIAQVVEHSHGKGKVVSANLAIGSHGINVARPWPARHARRACESLRAGKGEFIGPIPINGTSDLTKIKLAEIFFEFYPYFFVFETEFDCGFEKA